MAGIEWSLTLYQTATSEGLEINAHADGSLWDSYIGTSAITGTYDEATNALNFHTGGLRGNLYVTYYSGYAILSANGDLSALAGTYQERVFTLEPFGVEEKLGGWYAIPNIN